MCGNQGKELSLKWSQDVIPFHALLTLPPGRGSVLIVIIILILQKLMFAEVSSPPPQPSSDNVQQNRPRRNLVLPDSEDHYFSYFTISRNMLVNFLKNIHICYNNMYMV